RLTAPSRIFALPMGRRVGVPVVRQHLAQLGTTLLGGYLLGLAPLVAVTVVDAEFGGPDLPAMVSGLLGLTAAVTVGYLLGVLARTALIAPVPFLLFFAFAVAGSGDDTYAAVLPVLHVDPELGQVENPVMVVFRCAFFLLVTIAAGLIAAQVLTHRVPRPRAGLATAATFTAVPAVLAVLGISITPDLFRIPPDPPRQCAERHGIEYCVHQGHASQLDDLIAALDPVFTARGRQEQVKRVYDRALLFADPLTVPETAHVAVLTPNIPPASEASFVADKLAGIDGCVERYPHRGAESGGDHRFDPARDWAPRLRRGGEHG